MGLSCSRTGEIELEDLPLQTQVESVLAVSRARGIGWPPPQRGQPATVKLNLYNTQGSSLRHPFVLEPLDNEKGFHCGVEVHACEWSYGGEQRQWGSDWHAGNAVNPTGITCYVPRESPGHAFCESLVLGKTGLCEDEVLRIVQALGRTWVAAAHHPLTRSCLHFSDAFCQLLGVGGVPEQVRKLAAELQSGLPRCPATCCSSSFCSSHLPGAVDGSSGQDLIVLRQQLEQATLQLRQAQRELASERASHDDAIRQVMELKRTASPSHVSRPPSFGVDVSP